LDEITNQVKHQFELECLLSPKVSKGLVLLKTIPKVLKSLGFQWLKNHAPQSTIEECCIDKALLTKRGSFNMLSLITKIVADRVDESLELHTYPAYNTTYIIVMFPGGYHQLHYCDWANNGEIGLITPPSANLELTTAAKVYHTFIQSMIDHLESIGKPANYWHVERASLSPYLAPASETPEVEEKEVKEGGHSVQSETREHAI